MDFYSIDNSNLIFWDEVPPPAVRSSIASRQESPHNSYEFF